MFCEQCIGINSDKVEVSDFSEEGILSNIDEESILSLKILVLKIDLRLIHFRILVYNFYILNITLTSNTLKIQITIQTFLSYWNKFLSCSRKRKKGQTHLVF